jgi:hypothetical protein
MFKGSFSLFLILASIFKHNMNKKRDEFSFLFSPFLFFYSISTFYYAFNLWNAVSFFIIDIFLNI